MFSPLLAAVDQDPLAVQIGRSLAGDEGNHLADLGRLAETVHRIGFDHRVHDVLRHGLIHIGIRRTRRHAVHGDALLGRFLGQRIGKADHGSLGGGVVALPHNAPYGRRADIDDPAVALIPHVVNDLMAPEEGPVQIRVDDLHPLVDRHLVEHRIAGDPGIVDQNVDAPEMVLDEPCGSCDLLRI